MCQAAGIPTTSDLKYVIHINLARDNEITTEDSNLAEKAFKSEIRAIKCKSTRIKPIPAISQTTELPEELSYINEDVVMSIDWIKINGAKFLALIARDIHWRTAQPLSFNPNYEEYMTKIDELHNLHKQGNFNLRKKCTDKNFTNILEIFRNQFDPLSKLT